jgi:hypothetical protein
MGQDPGRGMEMMHIDSDWARATGLAGGTVLTMIFMGVVLFYIAQ